VEEFRCVPNHHWRFLLKRLSVLSLIATAAFAQQKPAPAAPVAPIATAPVAAPAPIAPATVSSVASTGSEAPLAPVVKGLLNAHPGAPVSIDDVLLVPHSSAGQKAATFEWANANQVQAFVLWNKVFAAAQVNPGKAQTLTSAGYMTPAWGAGVKLAYADSTTEDTLNNKSQTYYTLNQIQLFGSYLLNGMDLYGSLGWLKPSNNVWTDPSGSNPDANAYTFPRTDLLTLSVGLRKYPAAGVEGHAWNVQAKGNYNYARTIHGGGDSIPTIEWSAELYGQYGYVFLVDGISFLPGVNVDYAHVNAVENPDYANDLVVSPNVSVIVPLFENWTLMGGAIYNIGQNLTDNQSGKKSAFNDHFTTSNTTGKVGLRYVHGRWAADAAVENSFLASGPYFISGQSPAGGFLARLGFSLNLK
jgi:hypothetical protein